MKPRLGRRGFLGLAAACALAPRHGLGAPREILLHGGPIYTGLARPARVDALVARGDRVAYLGSVREARRQAPGAREIDLRGAAAYPGFVDAHAHLVGVGLRELTLDLTGTRSLAELVQRLRTAAARQPTGPIVGRGWIETHWPEARFPTRHDLDAVVADRPVYLVRADGHAGVANGAALALAGIDSSTQDPPGGRILRDAEGRPSGMLVDTAETLVTRQLPRPDAALKREALARTDSLYASRGWTGLHDMGTTGEELDLLFARADAGEQRLRIDAYLDPAAASRVLDGGTFAHPGGQVRVRGVKLYVDGALGSRGAALLQPYSDAPETGGLLQMPREIALDWFARARRAGAQMAVHAIGDLGNRLTLDWYEAALAPDPRPFRWRIEHAQTVAPADLPRFGTLGVIASMQPSHAIGDLYFAPARLGRERLRGAYAWRALLDRGAVICAGSDAPVEKGAPLVEFYAAVHRHSLDGHAGADWGLDQVVTRQEALRMLTWAPAFAAGREHELGTLAPGMLADVSAFSTDLMTARAEDIPHASAVLTMIGGRLAWHADGVVDHSEGARG